MGRKLTPRGKAWKAWQSALSRCNDPRDKDYHFYGGRGIRCFWDTFEGFYADVGDPPTMAHTLERVDPRGHYHPDNVIWATREEQNNNKRNTVRYPHEGRNLTLAQWARAKGIRYHTLYQRVRNYRWNLAEALDVPSRPWGKLG